MSEKSLYIGIPFTRPYASKTVRSLFGMDRQGMGNIYFQDKPNLAQDVVRNWLVHQWKTVKSDFFLFVDNDAAFAPDSVRRLMAHNLPVVCGCMYAIDVPPMPTMGRFMGVDEKGRRYLRFAETARKIVGYCWDHGVRKLDNNVYNFPEEDTELWEVDGCGMHFTLIRRDVLEALSMPMFVTKENTGAGEDFHFCELVQKAGFQIYADLSIHTSHCAGDEDDFGIKDLLRIMELLKIEDLDAEIGESFKGRLVVG